MKKLLVNRSVLWVLVALVIYFVVLIIYYIFFVSPYYERYGFVLKFDTLKFIETSFVFLVVLGHALMISKRSEFVFSIYVFFLILFLLPTLVLVAFCGQPRGPMYSIVAMLIALDIFTYVRIFPVSLQQPRLSARHLMVLLLVAVAPIFLNFGFYFNLSNVFLEDVYATRGKFAAMSSVGLSYLYNWLVKAIVPVLLAYFVIHKKRLYALFTFLILIYLYLISGNKIVYITAFVMLFFLYAGESYYSKVKYMMIALIAGLAIMPLVDYAADTHTLKGTFVMRTLFLPSQLNYYYFDFFQNEYLYYSESNFFKWFFDYPFDRPIGFVISETYFDAPNMNASNGIIGDGYMNLGYAGVAINIVLVGLIFGFFNSLRLDARYLGIFFVVVFLLLSAPMLSMFVTSGLLLLFVTSASLMKWTPRLGPG